MTVELRSRALILYGLPPAMKRCRVCGGEKSLAEFYVKPDCRDGLDNRCKSCFARILHENYKSGNAYRGRTWAKTLLYQRGIPVCSGRAVGFPYYAWAAFATVPIMPKLAEPRGQFSETCWPFTARQMAMQGDGFCMLMTDEGDQEPRVFIVPRRHPLVSPKRALTVRFRPMKDQTQLEDLLPFEDKYDLIREWLARALESIGANHAI
jgi:hypothetical protein